jgi:hypothetical protein
LVADIDRGETNMWKIRRLSRSGLSLVVGLVVGALTLGTTYAVSSGPSTSAAAAQVRTGYQGLSPMDFTPQHREHQTKAYYTSWYPLGLAPDVEQCFNTGLRLPGGTELQRIVMWFKGAGAGAADFSGLVFRSDPVAGTSGRIGATSAAGSGGITRLVVPIVAGSRVIRNDRWLYGVAFCAEDGMLFLGARAIYTR